MHTKDRESQVGFPGGGRGEVNVYGQKLGMPHAEVAKDAESGADFLNQSIATSAILA